MDINYKMTDTVLGITIKEKDVTIGADMKVSERCCIATSNVNQILGFITRNKIYQENLNIPLYKAIARPLLEYFMKAWR